ncbi:MAG: DMT family transporter [Bacteroidota bacterium]|nr:DMT family transporter [Bacteroidota bacterium]
MQGKKIRSDLILLLAAIIWGFAFIAQRVGMQFVGPFIFNGIRFSLGILVILPFLIFRKKRIWMVFPEKREDSKKIIWGSILTGIVLFIAISLQQIGIMTTTAGKAGFITGLYVVFVPVAGLFLGHKMNFRIWLGVILSLTGLYFLSMTQGLKMETGDFLVFLCAICFTVHVLLIAWLSPRMDSFLLAGIQYAICAGINLIVAFCIETFTWIQVMDAALPILYGGVLSVGVAYTLQVVAQKKAHPAYASIILSLESVFAVIGGWLILDEKMTLRIFTGCMLMLAGMIAVQIKYVKTSIP